MKSNVVLGIVIQKVADSMHSYFRLVQKGFSCNYISSGIQIKIKISKNVSYVGTPGRVVLYFCFAYFLSKVTNSIVLAEKIYLFCPELA